MRQQVKVSLIYATAAIALSAGVAAMLDAQVAEFLKRNYANLQNNHAETLGPTSGLFAATVLGGLVSAMTLFHNIGRKLSGKSHCNLLLEGTVSVLLAGSSLAMYQLKGVAHAPMASTLALFVLLLLISIGVCWGLGEGVSSRKVARQPTA